MPVYNAITRPYIFTEIIDFWIGGPSYTARDWCMVVADNLRDARGKAVRAFRKLHSPIFDDGECPFTGLKIILANQEEIDEAVKYKEERFFIFF